MSEIEAEHFVEWAAHKLYIKFHKKSKTEKNKILWNLTRDQSYMIEIVKQDLKVLVNEYEDKTDNTVFIAGHTKKITDYAESIVKYMNTDITNLLKFVH